MKALQIVKYGKIEDCLAFNDVNKPTVLANDVLIEVQAAAINPIDKSIILGNLQGMLPIPLPSTSAYDVSGIVVEKGNEVSNFEIGDLVYSRVPCKRPLMWASCFSMCPTSLNTFAYEFSLSGSKSNFSMLSNRYSLAFPLVGQASIHFVHVPQ